MALAWRTIRYSRHRFDWIRLAKELAFASYTLLPDLVSERQAVRADIRLKRAAAVSRGSSQKDRSIPMNGPLSSTIIPESKSVVK